MEPISTAIAAALVAGATAAMKDTVKEETKTAYQKLKKMVLSKWHKADPSAEPDQEAMGMLNNLEKDPDIYQSAVAAKLQKLLPPEDSELREHINQLYQCLQLQQSNMTQQHYGSGDIVAGDQEKSERTIILQNDSTYYEK